MSDQTTNHPVAQWLPVKGRRISAPPPTAVAKPEALEVLFAAPPVVLELRRLVGEHAVSPGTARIETCPHTTTAIEPTAGHPSNDLPEPTDRGDA